MPIKGTYEGRYSPIWVIRTGALNISTADQKDLADDKGNSVFENLSLDRRRSPVKTGFNFAQIVRMLMRGGSMPESRGSETDAYFDHFRITVSQMGMTYFQSYSIYEQRSNNYFANSA